MCSQGSVLYALHYPLLQYYTTQFLYALHYSNIILLSFYMLSTTPILYYSLFICSPLLQYYSTQFLYALHYSNIILLSFYMLSTTLILYYSLFVCSPVLQYHTTEFLYALHYSNIILLSIYMLSTTQIKLGVENNYNSQSFLPESEPICTEHYKHSKSNRNPRK